MKHKFAISVVIVLVLQNSIASPAIDNINNVVQTNRNHIEEAFLRKLNAKCMQRDNSSCVMLKLVSYMNKMLKKSSIEINNSFELLQTRVVVTHEPEEELMIARASGSDDATLSVILADKFWTFLRSRSLKWKMLDDADLVVSTGPEGNFNIGLSVNTQSALEKGRGRIRHLGPLITAIAAKFALLGAIVFKLVALLVGKALIVSKVALLLASIVAIKKLLTKKRVTYEVVPHAHHTGHDQHHSQPHAQPHIQQHASDSYNTGWGRALDGFLETFGNIKFEGLPDAHNAAFKEQKP